VDLPLLQTVLRVLEVPKVKAHWTLEIRLGNRIACTVLSATTGVVLR
jgi:hypothetical protein